MAANSYLYQPGVSPNTNLLNSQKVKLYAAHPGANDPAGKQIGVLQSWAPTQSRPTEFVRGIGFGDRVAEQSVGVTDLSGSMSIAVMYLVNIMQVFGYNAGSSGFVRSLKHHRWPFDIKEQIVLPNQKPLDLSDGKTRHSSLNAGINNGLIQTYYAGCWMQDYNITFEIGGSTVTQDASVNITDIYDPTVGYTVYDDTFEDRGSKTISNLFAQGPGQ